MGNISESEVQKSTHGTAVYVVCYLLCKSGNKNVYNRYMLISAIMSTTKLSQKLMIQGIPWRSSGQDSALSLPRAQVRSLVRELKSHKLRSVAKN